MKTDKLPPRAWSVNPTDPCLVICLQTGKMGYFEVGRCGTAEAARAMATRLNEGAGVTPTQATAMECRSMFGW
jgi:hypothetical protein